MMKLTVIDVALESAAWLLPVKWFVLPICGLFPTLSVIMDGCFCSVSTVSLPVSTRAAAAILQ